ncbi:23S rRNA (guanosine(2251)-2'-O)-methyltransferase RlmB [Chondrinema litorale]|uniref:23S rRNA (guanosine(2251)-2'-O)-methyltransferase RlmB n=1 Tax=Chondrinema litorale TaxID=2994555 RepID=UPI002544C9CD|nr:23S rRNA (guanosine(2251)-2'-O)-methyltransferase RlmB [Chondrinema litorale]UZR95645.1 23S rRNA (guanosine(2251)-2'-O)-methyltransferase RlmB [Chondrinema litorale]
MKNFKSKTPHNPSLIYGIHSISEALEAGKEVDKILLQRGLKNDSLKALSSKAASLGIPVSQVPLEKLNKLTKKNHQGIVGFLSAITYSSLDHIISELYTNGKEPFILILDRVTDVRNFGAIARTAECSGIHAIVIPAKGSAQVGPDAVKTSAGALNHIPVCRVQNLKQTVKFLQDSGLHVVACTEKTSSTIYDADFKKPCAIVMGSEEDGISDDILRISDELASIPMFGKIGSLNVSVATSVIIYEAIRQKISK